MMNAATKMTDDDIAEFEKAGVRVMLNEAQILKIVPVSTVTLWRMVKQKRFPPPSFISANKKIWYLSEIVEWQREIEGRHRSPRKKPARHRQQAAE